MHKLTTNERIEEFREWLKDTRRDNAVFMRTALEELLGDLAQTGYSPNRRITLVDQTIFDAGQGNCFQACVATVLGLTLDQVPHFVTKDNEHLWWQDFQTWCAFIGLKGLWCLDSRNLFDGVDAPLYIAIGTTSRGDEYHACVYRQDTMVHDPHPSRAGLVNIERVIFLFLDGIKVTI